MYSTLISPQELAAIAPQCFIVDCSHDLADPTAGPRVYAQAHLPGAVFMHVDHDLSAAKIGTPPVNGRHPLPQRAALAERLAALGLKRGQQVVVYDRSGAMYAVRLWWLLRWLGHSAVAVLDGGLQAWQAAGLPVTADVPTHPRGDFTAQASLAAFISKDDVAANLRTRARVLVDARAPERFRGEVEPLDPVAGHIPGALNRFFKHNLQGDTGPFKPREQLRAEFTALLGKYGPSEVVAQCGSGVTGCHHILAMEHAGLHGALLYPGSWSEWCVDEALPRASGA